MKRIFLAIVSLLVSSQTFSANLTYEQLVDSLKGPLFNGDTYRKIGQCQLTLDADNSLKVYFPKKENFLFLAYGEKVWATQDATHNLVIVSQSNEDRTVTKLKKSNPNSTTYDRVDFSIYYWESLSGDGFLDHLVPNPKKPMGWVLKFNRSCP